MPDETKPKPIISGEHLDLISALRGQVFLIESHEESGGSPSNAKFMRDAFEYLERYNGETPAEVTELKAVVAKLPVDKDGNPIVPYIDSVWYNDKEDGRDVQQRVIEWQGKEGWQSMPFNYPFSVDLFTRAHPSSTFLDKTAALTQRKESDD